MHVNAATGQAGSIGLGFDAVADILQMFPINASSAQFSVGGTGIMYLYKTGTGCLSVGGQDNSAAVTGIAASALHNGIVGRAFSTSQSAALLAAQGSNGQEWGVKILTELTTIAASATTTTAIQLPAGAVILAVTVRTTVVIPTATSYSVGDSGSATRYNTANVGVAANSTDSGTKAGAYYNASATGVLLTMNGGTPAANTGRVRVTIFYYSVTPPTS